MLTVVCQRKLRDLSNRLLSLNLKYFSGLPGPAGSSLHDIGSNTTANEGMAERKPAMGRMTAMAAQKAVPWSGSAREMA